MKKFAIAVVAALVAASAFAVADGIGNSYICINGTWYTGSGPSSGEAGIPDYAQGASAFGQIGTIYSLTLSVEASFQAWDSGSPDWGPGASALWMHYTIDGNDNDWHDVTMAYAGYGYGQYQNNMLIQTESPVSIDVSAFADDGQDHTISIYFGEVDGHYDQPAPGVNYVGTFQVSSVPEPATMSLLGLGALAMVIRRKLSK